MTESQLKQQEILKETADICGVPLVTVIDVINHCSIEVKRFLREVINGKFIDSINFAGFGKLALKKRFKAINFPEEPSNNPKYVAWLLEGKKIRDARREMDEEIEDRAIPLTKIEEDYEFIGNVYD